MLVALEPATGEDILPLALLKARVRVLASNEDTDIERMRAQAIDFVERYSGKALQRRQFQWMADRFCTRIALPVGPVESVDAISYYASDGTDTALEASDWYLGAGVVQASTGSVWPVSSGQTGSVRVTFTAGYEDAEAEAPLLIAAVEVAVAALFDDRESPNWGAAMALADSYRTPGL